MKNISFFEVESSAKQNILNGFTNSQWNGYELTVEISKPKPDTKKGRGKKSSRRKGKLLRDNKRKKTSGNQKKKSFKDRFKVKSRRTR